MPGESSHKCVLCGHVFCGDEDRGICSSCQCRPRVRTISTLIDEYIMPNFGDDVDFSKSALCFAMTSHERKILSGFFQSFVSVSLFGSYGKNHTIGVDSRDLSRYQDDSFCAHYSCLLFDYFVEHGKALEEAFRVVAPGGLFITHIEGPRLEDNFSEPRIISTIKPRSGYYEYIPKDKEMANIKVGKKWFLEEMRKVGFAPFLYRIEEAPSGMICEWFAVSCCRCSREPLFAV